MKSAGRSCRRSSSAAGLPRPVSLVALAALAALGFSSAGCSGRGRVDTSPAPSMGLYKVRLEEAGERTRRFKILLFAEAPDRLHGEILSPVGSTVMIFDSGAGQLAVTFVRDREAYVGTADPLAMEAVFGLRMTLGQLVGGLLTGEGGTDELRMVREASANGLPDRLELSSGPRILTLDLRRRLALRERPGGVGTGRPPEGMEERPLDELRLHPLPEEIEQTPTG